jgi:LemA protein
MKNYAKIFGLLVVAVMMLSSCGYNEMQIKDEGVKEAWGNVEAQYQRRNDLLPNLVEAVKGYASHEKETLTGVTEARAKVGQVKINGVPDAATMQQFQTAQGEVSNALSRLMVIVEKYPDLKANQNFADLQHQLEGTENRISVARTRYNEAVMKYNSSIRTFPNSMTNSFLLHLNPREPFKAEAGAEKAPKIKF